MKSWAEKSADEILADMRTFARRVEPIPEKLYLPQGLIDAAIAQGITLPPNVEPYALMETLPVMPLTNNPRIAWHHARSGSHYRVCGCSHGMDHYEAVPVYLNAAGESVDPYVKQEECPHCHKLVWLASHRCVT